MKSSTEIFTQQIKVLLDLDHEVRQKLSSTLSSTEQEMLKLEAWLEEMLKQVQHLDLVLSAIYPRLEILQLLLKERHKQESMLKH